MTTDPARLARVIASDIEAYNVEAMRRGLAKDSVFDELHDAIEEGRAHYNRAVSGGPVGVFERAIADMVMRQRNHVLW